MVFKDYYKALGVPRNASADEIKKAFRKAVRKYHPDINIGAEAEAKFRDVNDAYEVLKDPERRATYDQLWKEPPQRKGGYQPPPDLNREFAFSGGGPQQDEAFSNFFETLFRRGVGPMGATDASHVADSHGRIAISSAHANQDADWPLSLWSPVVGPNGRATMQDRQFGCHNKGSACIFEQMTKKRPFDRRVYLGGNSK